MFLFPKRGYHLHLCYPFQEAFSLCVTVWASCWASLISFFS